MFSQRYRSCARPASKVVGVAGDHQPCTAPRQAGTSRRGARNARRDLQLVHRGLRHRRPQRREGAPRRVERVALVRGTHWRCEPQLGTQCTSSWLRGLVQAAACEPESRRRRFHSRGVSSRTSRARGEGSMTKRRSRPRTAFSAGGKTAFCPHSQGCGRRSLPRSSGQV
jgi:hypothetical protein